MEEQSQMIHSPDFDSIKNAASIPFAGNKSSISHFITHYLPQQCLYFLPLPQGHLSLRPIFLPSLT